MPFKPINFFLLLWESVLFGCCCFDAAPFFLICLLLLSSLLVFPFFPLVGCASRLGLYEDTVANTCSPFTLMKISIIYLLLLTHNKMKQNQSKNEKMSA